MKRLAKLASTLAITAILAGASTSLYAAPKHGGASISVGRSLGQSLQRSGGNSFNRSPINPGNLKSQVLKSPLNNNHVVNRSPLNNIQNHMPLVKQVNPIVGTFNPIKQVNPIKPIGPIVGNPGPSKHCHPGWGWYPGVGIGIGFGGGYQQSSNTVVCQPVVLEVPAPAPAPVPVPSEAPAQIDPNAQPPAPVETKTDSAVVKLQQIRVGGTVELRAKELGQESGGVAVKVNDVILGCLVNDWKPDMVLATLPMLGIAGPTKAELAFILPNGKVVQTLQVELLPAEVNESGKDVASRP